MKKILSLLIVVATLTMLFVGCAPDEKADYSLAIGVTAAINADFSKVTKNVAAIVTDADGKIVLCRLDCVEYPNESNDAPVSKAEQGDAYDAYAPMEAGRWYQQVAALEAYVVGKTRAEVAAIAVGADGKTDLVAGCTIAISDLLAAIDKAFASEYKTAFEAKAGTLTAGLKVDATVPKDDEIKNQTTFSTNFSAAILSEGAVVAAILDTSEPIFKYDGDSPSFSYNGTKREQGDAYDAYDPMPGGRWYQQADAYAKAAVGLTADNIATLAAEGVAGCTIYAGGYKAGIEAAVKAAR